MKTRRVPSTIIVALLLAAPFGCTKKPSSPAEKDNNGAPHASKAGSKSGAKSGSTDKGEPAGGTAPADKSAAFAGIWEVQNSGVKDNLNGVTFVNDQLGWAVGRNNTILHTADGGKTWKRQLERKEGGSEFAAVLFTSPTEGWARTSILDTIMHTSNGGRTWEKMTLEGLNLRNSGSCAHAAVGFTYFVLYWGSYPTEVAQTVGGADKWIELTGKDGKPYAGGAGHGGASLSMADLKHGCIVTRMGVPAKGYVSITQDGGKTWQTQAIKDDENNRGGYAIVQMIDKDRGWYIPEFGTIHATVDSGKTWTPQAMGHKGGTLRALHFANAELGHVLVTGTPQGVWRTTNGGKAWQFLGELTKAPQFVYGMSFPGASHGWVVGEKGYIAHYHAK